MIQNHHAAAANLRAFIDRFASIPQRAGRDLAAAVQGHRGESTVSVTATGTGAQVQISGPDAAKQRAGVEQAVKAVLERER